MRREGLSDRFLGRAGLFPPPLRRRLARRAAARGLHVAALGAAGDDPEVLNRLGMHLAVLAGKADPVERAIALAGLGRIDEARALWAGGDPSSTRRLAATAAPSDPAWALELLGDGQAQARAACLLALDRPDAAEALLEGPAQDQETLLLRAAAASRRGDWREALRRVNAGLAPGGGMAELSQAGGPGPLLLESFSARPRSARPGGPLVSVVMAARNAGPTIGMALASLCAQTWDALEITVVDDGSTDDTAARVEAVGAGDPRVRLIRNDRAPGAYGARNAGILASRGDLIAFHDADDWAHPERIERQVAGLEGAAASICRHVRIDGGGRLVSPRVFPLVRLNPILVLVRRSVLDQLGPFEEASLGADSELLARLDAGLGRRATIRRPEVAVLAGWSGGSLMGAASTGLSPEGLARRVAYVENWRRRHADGQLAPQGTGKPPTH